MWTQQPVTPSVYELVEPTTAPTTVVDVLFGSLTVIGAMAVVAVVLGVAFAAIMIVVKRARGQDRLSGEGSSSLRLGLGDSSGTPAP